MAFESWSVAAPAVTAAFLASLVEVVEAFTIVLAVATMRGWRSAWLGTSTALAVNTLDKAIDRALDALRTASPDTTRCKQTLDDLLTVFDQMSGKN
jgi:hypothetical protein